MSRIPALDPADAQGKARDLLAAVNASIGVTPNLFRVAAQAPAALEGLLGLSSALAGGALGVKQREAIALAVAEANGCDYCLSAHTALSHRAGLSDAEIAEARRAHSPDPKTDAILGFARLVVEQRGLVPDQALAHLRELGIGHGVVVEIVAHVALNSFTNYLNHVAGTEIDFPLVQAVAARAA